MQHRPTAGFTIVELLIVITLTVIIMLTGISMFYTTLIGGGKTSASEYTKQTGEQTMQQLTYLIRNSRKILPNSSGVTCNTNMNELVLLNWDGGTTVLTQVNNGGQRIASNSAILTPSDLFLASAMRFDCTPTTYETSSWDGSSPRITVQFTLRKGDPAVDLARDIVALPFSATVTLRNN